MKGLFIFLVILCILFFGVKLGLTIWQRTKKENYYNNLLLKILNDCTIVACTILLYAFSISLYLANDYTMAECNFTLIVLLLAMVAYLADKIYFYVKNRGYLYIESNIYDLEKLAIKEEYCNVLTKQGKVNYILNDKESFEQMLLTEEKLDNKKFKNRLIKICLFNILGIILCVTILVLGLVRCA